MIIVEKVRLLFCLGEIGMVVEKVLCRTSSAFHHANDNELGQARVVHVGMDDTLDLNQSTLAYTF